MGSDARSPSDVSTLFVCSIWRKACAPTALIELRPKSSTVSAPLVASAAAKLTVGVSLRRLPQRDASVTAPRRERRPPKDKSR